MSSRSRSKISFPLMALVVLKVLIFHRRDAEFAEIVHSTKSHSAWQYLNFYLGALGVSAVDI
jgi:hypothetical protein